MWHLESTSGVVQLVKVLRRKFVWHPARHRATAPRRKFVWHPAQWHPAQHPAQHPATASGRTLRATRTAAVSEAPVSGSVGVKSETANSTSLSSCRITLTLNEF